MMSTEPSRTPTGKAPAFLLAIVVLAVVTIFAGCGGSETEKSSPPPIADKPAPKPARPSAKQPAPAPTSKSLEKADAEVQEHLDLTQNALQNCAETTFDYTECENDKTVKSEARADGVVFGTAVGQVELVIDGPGSYSLRAESESGSTFFLSTSDGGASTEVMCVGKSAGCDGKEWR